MRVILLCFFIITDTNLIYCYFAIHSSFYVYSIEDSAFSNTKHSLF